MRLFHQFLCIHRDKLGPAIVDQTNQVHGIRLTLEDDVGLVVKLPFVNNFLVVFVYVDFYRLLFLNVLGPDVCVVLSHVGVQVDGDLLGGGNTEEELR